MVITETQARVRFSKQCTSGLKVRTSGEATLGIDTFELRILRLISRSFELYNYLSDAGASHKAIKQGQLTISI